MDVQLACPSPVYAEAAWLVIDFAFVADGFSVNYDTPVFPHVFSFPAGMKPAAGLLFVFPYFFELSENSVTLRYQLLCLFRHFDFGGGNSPVTYVTDPFIAFSRRGGVQKCLMHAGAFSPACSAIRLGRAMRLPRKQARRVSITQM